MSVTDGVRRDGAAGAATTVADARGSAAVAAFPLETLVRNLAAVTAVFYVCGFFTTNAYLYRLGVSDFSLLRTRFVLTGALALTPLLQGIIWGIYAAVDVDVFSTGRRLSRRGYAFVLADVLVLFAFYFALFAFAADNDYVTAARQAALLSVLCLVVVLALLGLLVSYRVSERRPVSRMLYRGQSVSEEHFARRFGVRDVVVDAVAVAVVVVILLLTYLTIFGDRFYAFFPEQMGGGRPRTAQLLIAEGAIPAAQQLGFDVADGDPLSEPVALLWIGEESYVIRLPNPNDRTVVQVARGLVDGIVTGALLEPDEAGVAL
jgi:hypothetical protein